MFLIGKHTGRLEIEIANSGELDTQCVSVARDIVKMQNTFWEAVHLLMKTMHIGKQRLINGLSLRGVSRENEFYTCTLDMFLFYSPSNVETQVAQHSYLDCYISHAQCLIFHPNDLPSFP